MMCLVMNLLSKMGFSGIRQTCISFFAVFDDFSKSYLDTCIIPRRDTISCKTR